jgi:hypothetical protein
MEDQVAQELGGERQGPNKGSKAILGGMTHKYLDVQETPEGKVHSLKSAWLPSQRRQPQLNRVVGAHTVKKLLEP